MDFREKILTQAIVCCMIFVGVEAVSYLPGEHIDKFCTAVKTEVSRNYTVEEVRTAASGMLERAWETPEKMVSAILATEEEEPAAADDNWDMDMEEFVEENVENTET